MEISYDKPQEVVSIARETIIDLTSSNSKLSELTKPFESISSTMVVTKKEDGGIAVAVVSEPGMYEAKKRYSPSLESLLSSSSASENEFEINTSVIKAMQSKARSMVALGASTESADKLNDFSLRLESYYKRATSTMVPFVFTWNK
jgi:hypothetical protein